MSQPTLVRRGATTVKNPLPAAPDVESLELDIDLRASRIWAELEPTLRTGTISLGVIASAIRVAYAQGYADCLMDEGVSLYGDNGYEVPRR